MQGDTIGNVDINSEFAAALVATELMANPAVAPHLLARKYLKGAHEWVNIPRGIVEELVKHSRGAVIQSVEHLPVVQGACSIPKVVLQDCFDVIDTLQENASSRLLFIEVGCSVSLPVQGQYCCGSLWGGAGHNAVL